MGHRRLVRGIEFLPQGREGVDLTGGAPKRIRLYDEPIRPDPNQDRITLIVDNREMNEINVKHFAYLQSLIRCEKRTLPLGDYLWVERRGAEEYILDTIIERKVNSDLLASIRVRFALTAKDGRLREQLYRLERMEELRQVIVLIEGGDPVTDEARAEVQMKRNCEAGLRVNDRVLTHLTVDDTETIRYLQTLHAALQRDLARHRTQLPYAAFQVRALKNVDERKPPY